LQCTCKKQCSALSYPPVPPATVRKIFVKFWCDNFDLNLSSISLKSDENNGRFTWRPSYIGHWSLSLKQCSLWGIRCSRRNSCRYKNILWDGEFRSSGMWCCVFAKMLPQCSVSRFKGQVVFDSWRWKKYTSYKRHEQFSKRHIFVSSTNSQKHRCYNLKSRNWDGLYSLWVVRRNARQFTV
jgi:hypothetical protein